MCSTSGAANISHCRLLRYEKVYVLPLSILGRPKEALRLMYREDNRHTLMIQALGIISIREG